MRTFFYKLGKTLTLNFTSRKFWMTMLGLWVVTGVYWGAIKCLYAFEDPAQIAAFTTITQNYQWVVATIVLAYLGINGVTTWRNETASMAQNIAQSLRSETVIVDETQPNMNLREHRDE